MKHSGCTTKKEKRKESIEMLWKIKFLVGVSGLLFKRDARNSSSLRLKKLVNLLSPSSRLEHDLNPCLRCTVSLLSSYLEHVLNPLNPLIKVAETQVGHRSPTDDQKLDILEICFMRVKLIIILISLNSVILIKHIFTAVIFTLVQVPQNILTPHGDRIIP